MKDILKYGVSTGIFAMVILPFVVGSGMFFPYITGKAFTFRIITEIILAMWVVLAVLNKNYRPKCCVL